MLSLSRYYSFAVSHRSIGWGRKQITWTSGQVNPTMMMDWAIVNVSRRVWFETHQMRQQFKSLNPFAAGILRPHGQRGAAERRLPQPELDRPEGQVQQHRIGQLAPGKCTWPVGCLPTRYLLKDLSCLYTHPGISHYYFALLQILNHWITKENNLPGKALLLVMHYITSHCFSWWSNLSAHQTYLPWGAS